jgi:hypothetical protein
MNTRRDGWSWNMTTASEVVLEEVGEHVSFNGRYAIVRWKVSGRTKVDDVRESLRKSLPSEVGMYGRVSRKGDEVRAVIKFQSKVHYTDVLKHLVLEGQSEQQVYLAKLERPQTWEQFVGKGVKYVGTLRGGKVFGRVGSLVPVKEAVSSKSGPDDSAVEEGAEDDGNDEQSDWEEQDSDVESLYGLSADVRKLVLERDVAEAKVELAEAKLAQRIAELALFEGGG